MGDKIDNFIVCPYCDYRHPDQCDYPGNIDGNQQEMDCDNCEKTFDVIGELSWTFHTYGKKPTEEEEIDVKAKKMIRDSRLGREDLEE